jgi:drug/metabolite transporter (DMT)-like permease
VTSDRTISILFMIGSACFALGAVPGYAVAVGATGAGVTFFAGSLFFTAAACGQFLQSRRTSARGQRDKGWWAALVQLAGTLFFNASTLHALSGSLSATQQDQKVWRPDAYGSVCFLVASGLALAVFGRSWYSWRPHERPWWIAVANMTGSVAFGVSAVASYVVPDSGTVRNATLVNLGTFLGALCFLLGAYLLLPRRNSQPEVVVQR